MAFNHTHQGSMHNLIATAGVHCKSNQKMQCKVPHDNATLHENHENPMHL